MGSSHSHDHRDDVIAYPEQIGFAAKTPISSKTGHNLKNPSMKEIRQLNLEKKDWRSWCDVIE